MKRALAFVKRRHLWIARALMVAIAAIAAFALAFLDLERGQTIFYCLMLAANTAFLSAAVTNWLRDKDDEAELAIAAAVADTWVPAEAPPKLREAARHLLPALARISRRYEWQIGSDMEHQIVVTIGEARVLKDAERIAEEA